MAWGFLEEEKSTRVGFNSASFNFETHSNELQMGWNYRRWPYTLDVIYGQIWNIYGEVKLQLNFTKKVEKEG